MNIKKFTSFLFNASQSGYGTGNYSHWVKEPNRSTSIVYKEKDWEMHNPIYIGISFLDSKMIQIY
jgi:hypothetical protein